MKDFAFWPPAGPKQPSSELQSISRSQRVHANHALPQRFDRFDVHYEMTGGC